MELRSSVRRGEFERLQLLLERKCSNLQNFSVYMVFFFNILYDFFAIFINLEKGCYEKDMSLQEMRQISKILSNSTNETKKKPPTRARSVPNKRNSRKKDVIKTTTAKNKPDISILNRYFSSEVISES